MNYKKNTKNSVIDNLLILCLDNNFVFLKKARG